MAGCLRTSSEIVITHYVTGDTQKQLGEYKLKLKRAEQEITTLEGNVSISRCTENHSCNLCWP